MVSPGALTLHQAFSDTDRQVKPVLWRCKRAGPAWIERAGGMVGEVEIDDQCPGGRIPAQVGALHRIEHVAPRRVRLRAVRRVAKRQEEATPIPLDPVETEAPFAGGKRDIEPPHA